MLMRVRGNIRLRLLPAPLRGLRCPHQRGQPCGSPLRRPRPYQPHERETTNVVPTASLAAVDRKSSVRSVLHLKCRDIGIEGFGLGQDIGFIGFLDGETEI